MQESLFSPEFKPSQTELRNLYLDIDSAVKDPSQKLHVIKETRTTEEKTTHSFFLFGQQASDILDDEMAQYVEVKISDPPSEKFHDYNTILIFYGVYIESDTQIRLRKEGHYRLIEKQGQNNIKEYDLIKSPQCTINPNQEIKVYDQEADNKPLPIMSDAELDIWNIMMEDDTRLTNRDFEILTRLSEALTTS